MRFIFSAMLTGVLVSMALLGFSQKQDTTMLSKNTIKRSCPSFYIGINAGINAPNGNAGIHAVIPVVPHFSLKTSVGLSLWGFQAGQEIIGYFGDYHTQGAFSVGISYNSGGFTLKEMRIESFYNPGPGSNKKTYEFFYKTKPVWLTTFNGYYFFNNGKRQNRLFINIGATLALSDVKMTFSHSTPAGNNPPFGNLNRDYLVKGVSVGIGFMFNTAS